MRPATTTVAAGAAPVRQPTLRYLTQVALAAEEAGFEAALTPGRPGLSRPARHLRGRGGRTDRLGILVAFRPGFTLPTLLAQQAEAFQAISGGRLRLNVVTGGDPAEQRAYGDFLNHDERYARTAEYLHVLRRTWEGVPFSFTGDHYRVENAGPGHPLADPAGDLLRRRVPGGRARRGRARRRLPHGGASPRR